MYRKGGFVHPNQNEAIMLNAPTASELAIFPPLHSTASVATGHKIINMRFFLADFNWYAVEFDGQDTFMGFVAVCGNPAEAEWGYFSLAELQRIKHNGLAVDRDPGWEPVQARAVGLA